MFARSLLLLSCVALMQCSLEVNVQPTGAYSVLVNGKTWLQSGKTEFFEGGVWSSPVPVVQPTTRGFDTTLGAGFNQTVLTYTTPAYSVNAIVRQYDREDLVSFTTNFTTGMKGSNAGTSADTTSSRFPSFQLQKPAGANLGCMAWGGTFINNGNSGPAIGSWPGTTSTGKDGGPHTLFDLDSTDAIVLTHGSQFMSQSFESVNGNLASGVMGGVTNIPAGFSVSTIITYSGNGANNAMTQWGAKLMQMYGKTTALRDSDPILSVLGYNSDHGAYYYYHPAPNMTLGGTMLAVHAEAMKQQIPYKYILLDSWWYFKGSQNGVVNWTATPQTFPPGGDNALKSFTEATNWMVIGHNRYWDHSTTYSVHNGGKFNFSDDGSSHYVVPLTKDFWDFLMQKSKAWGLTTYEQDWLYNEFNNVPYLQQSATMAREWLMQMGNAAAKNGLTVQYCMPYPRHVLQSVEIPAVTQVRASDDYVPGGDKAPGNWNLGGSSILAHALALAPFKDNFWTSTQEPGGSCGSTTNPDVWRAAAVATLSNGPVTPGDGMQYMNKSMIMRACSEDGTLLRPARPITYLDSYIYKRAGGAGPDGHVWSTYTTVSEQRYEIVLSMVTTDYQLKPSELTLDRKTGVTAAGVYYTRDTKSFTGLVVAPLNLAGSGIPLTPPQSENDFHLTYVAPLQSNGWALLGELSKWVPVSSQRVTSVAVNGDNIEATVKGANHETVILTFYKTQPVEVHCTLPSSGVVVLTSSGSCKSQ
eukprot:TRINITY_DN330_c17_g1_i1.p1 TRINITY_DN330_c17_g1~~TRINITY_DN330_c17_g1_i1.p1  ORF type:complete len:753 (+),score=190.36 TRINITY_DN330_c17_g1_i1:65-2323(+)